MPAEFPRETVNRLTKELAETRAVLKDLILERLPKVYVVTLENHPGSSLVASPCLFTTLEGAQARALALMGDLGELIVDPINGLGPEQHDAHGRQLPERPPVRVVATVTWEMQRTEGVRCWKSSRYNFYIFEEEIDSDTVSG